MKKKKKTVEKDVYLVQLCVAVVHDRDVIEHAGVLRLVRGRYTHKQQQQVERSGDRQR